MKKNQFVSKKTVIIGGGITGLYLAWKLAEAGHKVQVFEKKKEIGKKECSGLVSEKIFKYIPQAKELIKTQIDFVSVHFPKKTFKIEYKEKFYILDHEQLDKQVYNLAKTAGADIFLDKEIDSLPTGFDRIIGCDGYNSFVRRRLNLPKPYFRLGMQVFLNKDSYDKNVEAWAIKNGFLWKIPRGDKIEYGVLAPPAECKKLFEDFCNKNGINFSNIQSSIVPQGFVIPKNNLITLCGDAAGLTKPWSGGGIAWDLMAAEILLDSFPDFLQYERKIKKSFLPKIIFSKLFTKFGYFMAFNFPYILPNKVKIKGDFLT